jgi:hypothetical protein
MLILRAAVVLLSVGVGSAYAGDDDGQVASPPSASKLAEFHPVLAGAPRSSPLFTIGGIEVHVWAPVAPPYNAEANGDLATKDIWSAG